MKKFYKILLPILLVIAVLMLAVFTSVGQKDNFTYEIVEGAATITGLVEEKDAASITVPASIEGYPVTAIGNGAFAGNTSLRRIQLPDSLTTIGARAFDYCTLLGQVALPDGLMEIGDRAFYGCKSLVKINVPDSVFSIGSYAFADCRWLTEVDLGDSITAIGDRAFSGCSSLAKINLPDTVVTLGEGVFHACIALKEIQMPVGVTVIGKETFSYCSSLAQVDLSPDTTVIDTYAFLGCTSLAEMDLPDAVTTLGYGAFSGCVALTNLSIPKGVTAIPAQTFYNCASLEEMSLPKGVTAIGAYAFAGCSALGKINIPEGITVLEDGVFSDCSSLAQLKLPKTLTEIGNRALYGCSSLEELNIPKSVIAIGDLAFSGCYCTVANKNPMYTAVDGILFSKDQTVLIQFPGVPVSEYSIPESVHTIHGSAFRNTDIGILTMDTNVEKVIGYLEGLEETTVYCYKGSFTEEELLSRPFPLCASLLYITKYPNSIIMQIDSAEVLVKNTVMQTDAPPIILNDRSMLPVRFVAENLGATIAWDAATRKVTIAGSDVIIELYIDNTVAYVNGDPVLLDAPACIYNDRTYTPVRFVAEALGATVEWNGETREIILTK